ncbi:MAG: hypothetical protein ACK5RL_13040 [Acidimicrobiales bacterium]
MLERLVTLIARRAGGGGTRSVLYVAVAIRALRMIRNATKPEPKSEVLAVTPGQRIIIDSLPISHAKQIKQMKQDVKAERYHRDRLAEAKLDITVYEQERSRRRRWWRR